MISVTLDEEMEKEFYNKAPAPLIPFEEGIIISLCIRTWVYGPYKYAVFVAGPEGINQYDEEFTRWLEKHRPEVFL